MINTGYAVPNYQNQFGGNNVMYMNQNNINIYGYPQNNMYNSPFENSYIGYDPLNNYNKITEKSTNSRIENYIPKSIPEQQNINLFCNFPSKSPQNSYSNITEESINEYMENFKKTRQNVLKNDNSSCKEISEKQNSLSECKIKEKSSLNGNIPNGGEGSSLSMDCSFSKTFDNNISSESKQSNNLIGKFRENESTMNSPFTMNDSEIGKKMASASLSYYFDFHPNNAKNFKLNLFDNFPYKFEATDKMKLFNDNEEENLIYNTAKIIDIKSESEDENNKYQNFFGPHRSRLFLML